jgi:hypothetical protein
MSSVEACVFGPEQKTLHPPIEISAHRSDAPLKSEDVRQELYFVGQAVVSLGYRSHRGTVAERASRRAPTPFATRSKR